MNKFANVIRAIKVLRNSVTTARLVGGITEAEAYAWKVMVDEAVDAQHEPLSEAENLEWSLMVVEVQLNASKSVFDRCSCGAVMEKGAAVCDACLEESELMVPSRCLGCGKEDRKVSLDFCHTCETDGTEFRLRGGHL
jgi:hypothetical protein